MSNATQRSRSTAFIDTKAIENERRKIINAANKVNAFISIVEADLRLELNDEQKMGCYQQGMHFIEDLLRPMYPFPNGDDQFNRGLLGFRLDRLKEFHDQHFGSWSKHRLDLINGCFRVKDIENHFEFKPKRATVSFERQGEIFRRSCELSGLLNILDQKGFLSDQAKQMITAAIPVVVFDRDENGIKAFRPNTQLLTNMPLHK